MNCKKPARRHGDARRQSRQWWPLAHRRHCHLLPSQDDAGGDAPPVQRHPPTLPPLGTSRVYLDAAAHHLMLKQNTAAVSTGRRSPPPPAVRAAPLPVRRPRPPAGVPTAHPPKNTGGARQHRPPPRSTTGRRPNGYAPLPTAVHTGGRRAGGAATTRRRAHHQSRPTATPHRPRTAAAQPPPPLGSANAATARGRGGHRRRRDEPRTRTVAAAALTANAGGDGWRSPPAQAIAIGVSRGNSSPRRVLPPWTSVNTSSRRRRQTKDETGGTSAAADSVSVVAGGYSGQRPGSASNRRHSSQRLQTEKGKITNRQGTHSHDQQRGR